MMNMMDRFVEGRGHQREIDMLLELTYVMFLSSEAEINSPDVFVL